MSKKDFPWAKRQLARLRCQLLCRLGNHRPQRIVSRYVEQRLLRPFDDQLHGRLPEAPDRGVIFLACDERYYQEFGIYLVGSALSKLSDFNVHLHINNLSEGYRTRLECFAAGVDASRFSFTYDRIPFDHLPESRRWYYLASVRFIRLYQLLRHCGKPVLGIDADSLIAGTLGDHFDRLCRHDIGIYLRPNSTLEWRKVLASALWLSPTPTGIAFARDTALSIAWLLKGELAYHIDQFVLHEVYQYYRQHVPGFRALALDQDILSWDCRPHSVVWSAKGDRKHEDPVFLNAQRQVETEFASVEAPALAQAQR